MYNEDFASERKDRENLHARLLRKEEELATKEKELQSTRQRFEEELQTKNQQVKQYKRQVDAVKADLDKCQMDLNQVTVCMQDTCTFAHHTQYMYVYYTCTVYMRLVVYQIVGLSVPLTCGTPRP